MQFKLDEHLPLEIKDLLAQHRHDPVTVVEEGMGGSVDPDVAQVCLKESRSLLTLDLDFSDIRTYPPEDYHGIVVFRPAIQNITTLVRLTAYSEPNRPPIPTQTGHLFRFKSATVTEQIGHPLGDRLN
jgi:predicted nuclease of predicted toxin-antitoxin system